MPAELVAYTKIPELATHVKPEALNVLRRFQKNGSIMNGREVVPETMAALQELTDLGLIDAAYDTPSKDQPYLWTINGNGSRVLSYVTGIRGGPYYTIGASDLADWLVEQGENLWWNVDGDPLLTGRMSFPCPGDELARELRNINRILLVQAKKGDAEARGQRVGKEKLNALVGRFEENFRVTGSASPWGDRLLYLCWEGSPHEWLLAEDSETTAEMRAQETASASDVATVRKD